MGWRQQRGDRSGFECDNVIDGILPGHSSPEPSWRSSNIRHRPAAVSTQALEPITAPPLRSACEAQYRLDSCRIEDRKHLITALLLRAHRVDSLAPSTTVGVSSETVRWVGTARRGAQTGPKARHRQYGRGEPLAFSVSSQTNSDDRLPADPLGRIESADGIVEGRDVADVCTQSSVPHPLDDLT